MQAMIFDAKRDFCWHIVPEPQCGPGEVLLEIHATALNRADLLQRAGKYPPPPGWPDWPGLEAAGVILQAPAGSRWQKGERVCALLGGGGYAERVAVPEELLLPVPQGLSLTEAAALPEVFATSYLNLVLEADLQAGETVLIQAGASGLGLAAIQTAKALGATVMTTVGSAAKAEAVRQIGADIIINRHTDDLGAAMDAHPVNVVLDCVGGPALGENFSRLARGGRWVLIATLGGEQSQVSLRSVLSRGLRLIGSTLRSRSNTVKGQVLAALEQKIWPLLEDKSIRPVIHRVLPIQEVHEAHRILADNENIGKVVLTLKDS
ncbi:MAG: NAD(P)H-quinone oxidoreductase [Lentisphaeria bacterium]